MNKKLKKVIENFEWKICSDTCIETWSDLGENLVIECNKPSELKQAIIDEYESFDIDEHVEMWIRARAHGTRGIPSSVSQLVEDAKKIDNMLYEFANAVRNI